MSNLVNVLQLEFSLDLLEGEELANAIVDEWVEQRSNAANAKKIIVNLQKRIQTLRYNNKSTTTKLNARKAMVEGLMSELREAMALQFDTREAGVQDTICLLIKQATGYGCVLVVCSSCGCLHLDSSDNEISGACLYEDCLKLQDWPYKETNHTVKEEHAATWTLNVDYGVAE